MTTTTFSNALLPLAGTDTAIADETPRKPSFFDRVITALQKSREAQARREIARVQAMLGPRIAECADFGRNNLPFNT